MFYVSSIAFSNTPLNKISEFCSQNGLNLEFSSGIPFSETNLLIFNNFKGRKLVHNYFPAPRDPFVINLASNNIEIRRKSIEHCINGLKLTKQADAPFYAAHAGFCIDPHFSSLGKILTNNEYDIIDKKKHWNIFIDSINEILPVAEELNINFLIENNVITKFNLLDDGFNPLLCCDNNDITRLCEHIESNNFGILLDTGHYKISSKTLGFDMLESLLEIKSHIKALHHSDNDGMVDSNSKLDSDYWFVKFLPYFKNIINVIEVKNQSIQSIKKQIDILKWNY